MQYKEMEFLTQYAAYLIFQKKKKRYQPPFKANAEYRILLHTDWERFGGQTREVIGTYQKQVMELAPFSAILLKRM